MQAAARSTVHDFLREEEIKALFRPVEEATGLPGVVYTSPEFFELERHKIFRKGWHAAGFAHEIPAPGDAIPLLAAGLPIMVVRGERGEIRAFHNVCRHRGTKVLLEPVKGAKNFRCVYHSWTYGIDGRLWSTPFWDSVKKGTPKAVSDSIKKEEMGLVPVRCDVLWDMIFIDLSGTAPPLRRYYDWLVKEWSVYDLDNLEPVVTEHLDSHTNWKLGLEGAYDFYHEPFVHPQLQWSHPQKARLPNNIVEEYEVTLDKTCIGMSTDWDIGHKKNPWPNDLALIPGPPVNRRRRYIFGLFPNVIIALMKEHMINLFWTPLACGRTRVSASMYFAKGPGSPETERGRAAVMAFWGEVNEQDVAATQAQQEARFSDVANDIKFCKYGEDMVHYFQQRIVEELL